MTKYKRYVNKLRCKIIHDQLFKLGLGLLPTGLDKVLQAFEIEKLFSSTKRTSPRINDIPYWNFRNCSDVISLSQDKIGLPPSCKRTVVTPISMLTPITGLTYILSGIVEKVSCCYLQHVLSQQFAFRPTGSTTAYLYFTTK